MGWKISKSDEWRLIMQRVKLSHALNHALSRTMDYTQLFNTVTSILSTNLRLVNGIALKVHLPLLCNIMAFKFKFSLPEILLSWSWHNRIDPQSHCWFTFLITFNRRSDVYIWNPISFKYVGFFCIRDEWSVSEVGIFHCFHN